MAGLKSFWIIISTLFVLAACVPQTKQTECGSNEAFNASLRTCVPVVGGPSSFINVESYTPMFTQTRSKDDTTMLTFAIAVSNPYNQSYSVEWERVFNAAPVNMCSNALTCSFPASLLGTTLGEVGTHILTAKIIDGNGTVVDTHSFEIKINDLPKPVINTATITPAFPAFDKLPSDANVQFSFTIKNNNATIVASDNYRTVWTVQKNGSTIYSETDSFVTYTPGGTNPAYLGVSPTPWFNPDGALLGVGAYIVRAVVINDVPGEVVAEQQWSVTVRQPDLANVTTISMPAPGVTITAHHGLSYGSYPTYTWIDAVTTNTALATQRFCVTVDDRDGTYATDAKAIQVRWYLDSLGGEICQKTTLDTPGTQTICLIDANNCDGSGALFTPALLTFSNTSPSVPQNHKVTARLFDEATTYEFERADVLPSSGSYPIEWLVLTKPVNSPPTVGFGSTQPSGCITSGSFAKSNCLVNQGADFTVSFTTTDDFYSPTVNADKFRWDVKVKKDGSDLTTPDVTLNTSCSKAFGTAVTLPATHTAGYTTQWTCRLNVPHYTSSGPLNPASGTYQVVLTMDDFDSPVGGSGQPAQNLTWNLVVSETNPVAPALTLNPQVNVNTDSHVALNGSALDPALPGSFATELQTVLFRLNVTDPELDDFKYRISLCTDNTSACATSVVLTSPSYVDFLRASQTVPSTNPVLASGLLYTLPEDLLIGKHATPIDVDTATSRLVYFKVDITDSPSVGTTTARSDSEIFSFYVRNYNPAPVINTATASPAVASTTVVYSGYPLTIDPGSVTDASVPAAERNLQYQWYAKIGAGAWTAVAGATSRILTYTPGNTTSTIDLKLCVGDGTAANPVSSTGACSGSWFVTSKPYLYNLTATGAATLQNEMAVWYDETNAVANTQVVYSAYVDDNEDILVEKTVKNTSDNIIVSTRTIKFEALDVGATTSVQNISITGSDDSVYVAYIASTGATPDTMVPRIRRIDKNFDTGLSQTKSGMDHPAPFGFNYDQYDITCAGATPCTDVDGNGTGGPAVITFAVKLTAGDTVAINGYTFTASAAPVAANQICDSVFCANTNSQALSLATKINSSVAPELQGITALAVGNTVQLYGQFADDYLDFDGSSADGIVVASNGMGQIFVSGGRWHLPIINASLAGPEQNNITVLSGNVDVHMRAAGLALNTNDNLTEMGKVAAFDSKLGASGQLVFARISSELGNAGRISLYRYQLSASDWSIFDISGGPATDQNEQAIFGTYDFEYVKLAADNTSNPYYYVIAREETADGAEYHMGRYNNELDSAAAVNESFVTTQLLTSDATDDVISDAKLKFPVLVSVPGYSEARIFFHSVGTGVVPYPRLARWKSDNTISCGTCFSLNGSLEYQSTAKIGISQVSNDLTLGAAGATASENVNDVVFTLFSSDVGNDDIFKPQLGIINIDAEVIQSTAVDATGLFQPPFALD